MALGFAAPARAANPVTEWNQHAVTLTLSATPRLSPAEQTRVMAIAQIAVHDAVTAIAGDYATYLRRRPAPAGASLDAAAIGAANSVLRGLFPTRTAQIDAWFADSLDRHGVSEADPGIAFGAAVAAAILAHRAGDGSADAQFDYDPPGAGTPGVWIRLGGAPALLPGWGDVTPFVLRSGSQFRPDAPPALDSKRYARDYNEVKDVGRADGSTRLPEQTDIAQFWRASPTAIWNDVLVQVLDDRALSLAGTARAFALFYLAAADASIACWDAKYVYNYWRPQPAIAQGDEDGNAGTVGEPGWVPHIATPPHPEYPSGHTSNSAAMAAVLQHLFGDHPGRPLVVTITPTPGADPITRVWQTFSEAVREVIDARIYSGFHFRTADETGARLGRKVARFVVRHELEPCRGNRCK